MLRSLRSATEGDENRHEQRDIGKCRWRSRPVMVWLEKPFVNVARNVLGTED